MAMLSTFSFMPAISNIKALITVMIKPGVKENRRDRIYGKVKNIRKKLRKVKEISKLTSHKKVFFIFLSSQAMALKT